MAKKIYKALFSQEPVRTFETLTKKNVLPPVSAFSKITHELKAAPRPLAPMKNQSVQAPVFVPRTTPLVKNQKPVEFVKPVATPARKQSIIAPRPIKPSLKSTQRSRTANPTVTRGYKKTIQTSPSTRAYFGFKEGVLPVSQEQSVKKRFGEETLKTLQDSKAYRAGEIGGLVTSFAVPYAGASGAVGQAVSKVPKVAKMGKLGQAVTKSVATDLAVGVPLNVNYAYNKEGLRGKEALKNIGLNTGLDLALGGAFETVGAAIKAVGGKVKLKNGKSVSTQADFDVLTPPEKEEVVQYLLPAPKQTVGEGTVIAGGESFQQQFKPMKRSEYEDSIIDAIAKMPNPARTKKPFPPEKIRRLQEQGEALSEELGRISKMTDSEWETFAKQNDLGSYSTNFTPRPQKVTEPPLEFRTQISNPKQVFTGVVDDSGARTLPRASELKDLGADTNRIKDTMQENIDAYGKMEKGEKLYDADGNMITKDVDVAKATAYGENQQYARTLLESPIVDDVLAKEIEDSILHGGFAKTSKSNKTSIDNANRRIDQNIEQAYNDFGAVLRGQGTPTSEDIALGNRLLQEFQKTGEYSKVMNIAGDLSLLLSEAGRTLQAARIAKRLSPEGRLRMLQKSISKIESKTGKKIQLPDEILEKVSRAKSEKEIAEINQKAFTEIWNQVPANWIDKINAWRYMSMLTNPKTHIRNVVGNSIFVPAREFKNIIGTALEKTFKTEERTKAILNPASDRDIIRYAKNDFQNVEAILKNEGKYEDNLRKLDAKVFNTKWLEKIREKNMNALDIVDAIFMKTAYSNSLAQYMKANKLTVEKMSDAALSKARGYAMNEALKATYRDFNSLSEAISKTKKNWYERGGGWKAGSFAIDAVVPFTKTPINILRRGFEYSPAGLVQGFIRLGKDLKAGKTTAESLDRLAAGLTGTGMFCMGMFLYDKGIAKATSEAKRGSKQENFERMQGEQNYSLSFGDYSYTIDWAAPLSMPFFVGVETKKMFKNEGFSLNNLIDAAGTIVDPVFNISMLQGVNELVSGNFSKNALLGIGQDVVTGYASQFLPTVLGQVAKTVDDTRRTTTSTNVSETGRYGERFARQQMGKIPGLSKMNEPYVDLWGNEEVNPSVGSRIFQNFISPGFIKTNKNDPVDNEIDSLAKELRQQGIEQEKINAIYPRKTNSYEVTVKKQTYRMTEKELTQFNKVRGYESYKKIQNLFRSSFYRSASDEERIRLISKAYDEAFEVAKSDFMRNK